MVGMIVWAKGHEDRPNDQRGRVEAVAADHLMVTMLDKGKIECIPIGSLCGLQIGSRVIRFKITQIYDSEDGLDSAGNGGDSGDTAKEET